MTKERAAYIAQTWCIGMPYTYLRVEPRPIGYSGIQSWSMVIRMPDESERTQIITCQMAPVR